jgi:uncharacterized protein (DUF983 family)
VIPILRRCVPDRDCRDNKPGNNDCEDRIVPDSHSYPPLSPFRTGLTCRCPRCGKGRLFQGFLGLRPRCEVCGLDYAFADSGDGPAVFVIMLAGFVVVAAALIVEIRYEPPLWLHAVLWGPLIVATTLLPLRPMKGLMIALQYHHRAVEGRTDAVAR